MQGRFPSRFQHLIAVLQSQRTALHSDFEKQTTQNGALSGNAYLLTLGDALVEAVVAEMAEEPARLRAGGPLLVLRLHSCGKLGLQGCPVI